MFELLYQILHQNWRYFFKTSVLTSVQRGAAEETMENEAQFTAAMQVSVPSHSIEPLYHCVRYFCFSNEELFIFSMMSCSFVPLTIQNTKSKQNCVCVFCSQNPQLTHFFISELTDEVIVESSLTSFPDLCWNVVSRRSDSRSCSPTSTSSSRTSYIWSRWTPSTSCITEWVELLCR